MSGTTFGGWLMQGKDLAHGSSNGFDDRLASSLRSAVAEDDRGVVTQKVRISVFGGPKITGLDGSPVPISGRKSLALIIYLSRCPDMTASKERLADLLWSDRGDDQARNSLRQTLTVLRRELASVAPDLIVTERHDVRLRSEGISGQAEQFLELVASGNEVALRTAAGIYTGPFLDGFFTGSGVFEDWAQTERDEFQAQCINALDTLARVSEGEAGLSYARRLLAIDPSREASHRLMMELYSNNGQRDRALRQYVLCKDMLKREFGVEPEAETHELLRSLQAETRGKAGPEEKRTRVTTAPAQTEDTLPTVRVLEFVNLSGQREQDLLVAGLADDIVTALSRQREIIVLSGRHASGDDQVSRQASHILTGSVQRSTNRLRVNAQLIDVSGGQHLWAERFDGQPDDILSFQESVANSIALAVRIDLLLASWRVRDRTPADEPTVRILVQRAFVKYYEWTAASLPVAKVLAEQALSIDPQSVRAMRTLSFIISASMSHGVLPKSPENTDRALDLARQSVSAVPEDELGRMALTWALSNLGRHADALEECRYAIRLNPRFPTAYADMAEQYAYLGMADEAKSAALTALKLSSHDPIEFWRHYSVVVAQFSAEDYEAARAGAHQIILSKPGFTRAALFWAASAAAIGNQDEAAEAAKMCLTLKPGLSLGNVAPGFMPRYVQDAQHERFMTMLAKAGLPA